jgi:hypothetical protein
MDALLADAENSTLTHDGEDRLKPDPVALSEATQRWALREVYANADVIGKLRW